MSARTAMSGRAPVAILATVALLALAGCGHKASTSTTASPSPAASQSSLSERLAAVTGYLSQVRPIATQAGTTLGGLTGAVKGLHTKPDATWTTAAAKLKAIAAKLHNEAASLAALKAPDGLKVIQDAAVNGIGQIQSTVNKVAGRLSKRSTSGGVTKAKIQSQIATLQAQAGQLGKQLLGAIQSAVGSPIATPAP